jgi:hypothetical protein
VLAALVLVGYGGAALWLDPINVRRTPADLTATPGFQSDEATYYLMGQSLVHDFDLEYRTEDIARVRTEFPLGPDGVFLKRGTTLGGAPDPVADRLFYGKAFVYPLFAAPFVFLFGTAGFHVFNAVLLAFGVWLAYVFLSARSGTTAGVLLSAGFFFASVVPVYWAWIAPELFNCVVGMAAMFCWLYKYVVPEPTGARTRWLWRPSSDLVAAALIGLLTFSKATNALLGLPLGLWLLWRRDWARAAGVAVVFALSTAAWFGANVAISGQLSYQGGGDRATCYAQFPFEHPGQGLEVCDTRATNEALVNVWFDPEVFWSNLRANLGYFIVGRYGGLIPYFFPAVAALAAFLFARRRRETWQWLVLAGIAAQVLTFLIVTPYSYLGGGGSVGNRYFMGAYGAALFLWPPVRSVLPGVLMWLVGAFFMARLVISPFDTSMRPGDRGYTPPLRWFPVEMTQFNDLPIKTEGELMQRTFGAEDLRFQLLYLDKNSWLQEGDRMSFWTRGSTRADLLLRTVEPEERFEVRLGAGEVGVEVTVTVEGSRQNVSLSAGQTAVLQFALPPGQPYKQPGTMSYIWRWSVETDNGFVPTGGLDSRFLGVRVTPVIVRPSPQ